jgi:hypothetical protein
MLQVRLSPHCAFKTELDGTVDFFKPVKAQIRFETSVGELGECNDTTSFKLGVSEVPPED